MESIVTNNINSRLLLRLTENNLKELARVIRDRVCLRKVLEEVRKVGVPVTECSSTIISAVALSSTHTHTQCSMEISEWYIDFNPKTKHIFTPCLGCCYYCYCYGGAGRETTQVLHTYMTAHTIYLTLEQYKTVCSKLVSKYSILKGRL